VVTPSEAYYRARLSTLHGSGGTADDLDRLRLDAAHTLGAGHSVTLLIECSAEYIRSRHRPVEDSVDVWSRLKTRASDQLAPDDPTLMAIRAYHARYVRYRAEFGDLDVVVGLRTRELSLREAGAPGGVWIGIARADLAVALIDRAQYGDLDPTLEGYEAHVDLQQARVLIEDETKQRGVAYGGEHPFTWHARGILARTLLALGDKNVVTKPAECAGEALEIADNLIQRYRRDDETFSAVKLRARLTRAEALIGLGRHDEAARQARLVYGVSQAGVNLIDPAWPLLLLARAQQNADRRMALENAERALAVRAEQFGANSYKVAEAQRLVTRLAARG
jgi:hypothetical protein